MTIHACASAPSLITARILNRAVMVTIFAFSLLLLRPAYAQDQSVAALQQWSEGFQHIAAEVRPAVVHIVAKKKIATPTRQHPLLQDPFFRRFFGPQTPPQQQQRPERQQSGQGTGFIISSEGYILTNHHVAGDADEIEVTLSDGREFYGEVVGTDSKTDVALIKINAPDLTVLKMGSSQDARIGEWVMAIGNPFGLSQTVTAGIISATGRSSVGIVDYENFIQTDAAINPGNSGGPLVNLRGEAIGINTAIFSKSGGYMGIGFAIPIDMVKNIYGQLRDYGSVSRGFLGVQIQDLDGDLAASFGLENTDGIIIAQVSPDSPAEDGGLQGGDLVVQLNGQMVKDVASFRNAIALTTPGTEVHLEIQRDGETRSMAVTLGTLPGEERIAGGSGTSPAIHQSGLTLKTLTPALAQQFEVETDGGVIITDVKQDSPAAIAGLRPGMLISHVNGVRVDDKRSALGALSKAQAQSAMVRLRVQANGYTRFVVLKLT